MNTQHHPEDSPEDKWLVHALRDTPSDYLMDEGFTIRVTESLPSKHHIAWRRTLIITLGVVLGIFVAALAAGRELISLGQYLYQQASGIRPLTMGSVSIEFDVIVALIFSGAIAWISWRRVAR